VSELEIQWSWSVMVIILSELESSWSGDLFLRSEGVKE